MSAALVQTRCEAIPEIAMYPFPHVYRVERRTDALSTELREG